MLFVFFHPFFICLACISLSFCNAIDIPPVSVDCRENMLYLLPCEGLKRTFRARTRDGRARIPRQLQAAKLLLSR
jgi:hypothetical protein